MNHDIEIAIRRLKRYWIEICGETMKPALDSEIVRGRALFEASMNFKLPAIYLELMTISNGFDYDGRTIHAISPVNPSGGVLLEVNQKLAGLMGNHVLFGAADDTYFLFDRDARAYRRLDPFGLNVIEDYATADSMFLHALTMMVDPENDLGDWKP
jgi:hypothetical protein